MALLPPDPVFCFKGDMDRVHSICFPRTKTGETTQLIAATEKGSVYIWSLETNRLHYKQNMGKSIQTVHAIDNDIIIHEKSGTVTLWSVEDRTYVAQKQYECEGGFCKSIIIDDCIVLPQSESTIDVVVWSTMEKKLRLSPGKTEDDEERKLGYLMAVEHVKLGDKDCILGGYETGDIILWDYGTGEQLGHTKLRDHITSLTFDPVTRRGVCSNASNVLEVFGIDADHNITTKCEVTVTNDGCNKVKLRPDGKIFVHCGWDGKIRIYSWKTMRVLVVLTEHKSAVTDVQYSPDVVKYWDSKIFAASGEDGRISLWDIYK